MLATSPTGRRGHARSHCHSHQLCRPNSRPNRLSLPVRAPPESRERSLVLWKEEPRFLWKEEPHFHPQKYRRSGHESSTALLHAVPRHRTLLQIRRTLMGTAPAVSLQTRHDPFSNVSKLDGVGQPKGSVRRHLKNGRRVGRLGGLVKPAPGHVVRGVKTTSNWAWTERYGLGCPFRKFHPAWDSHC
jgi:hypothetical protein